MLRENACSLFTGRSKKAKHLWLIDTFERRVEQNPLKMDNNFHMIQVVGYTCRQKCVRVSRRVKMIGEDESGG